MGRPTLYSEEIIKKAEEYLASCQDADDDNAYLDTDPDEELEPQSHGGALKRRYKTTVQVKIPTIGGLASYLGVSRETLRLWASEIDPVTNERAKPAFFGIMERLGSEQEDRLIQNGLGGQYNPTIAKVLLTKHGYTDKVDLTTKDEKLPTPIFGIVRPTDNAIPEHNSDEEDNEA